MSGPSQTQRKPIHVPLSLPHCPLRPLAPRRSLDDACRRRSLVDADGTDGGSRAGRTADCERKGAEPRFLRGARDDDVLEVAGKQMSKRALLAHVKALRDASAARGREADEQAIQAARAAHAKKEKAAVDAANAPVVAQMSALRLAPPAASAPAAPAPAGTAAAQPAVAAPSYRHARTDQAGLGRHSLRLGFGTLKAKCGCTAPSRTASSSSPVDSWQRRNRRLHPAGDRGARPADHAQQIVTKAALTRTTDGAVHATRELRKVKLGEFTTHQCRDAALSFDTCKTIGAARARRRARRAQHSGVPRSPRPIASRDAQERCCTRATRSRRNGLLAGAQEWLNPIVLAETYAVATQADAEGALDRQLAELRGPVERARALGRPLQAHRPRHRSGRHAPRLSAAVSPRRRGASRGPRDPRASTCRPWSRCRRRRP